MTSPKLDHVLITRFNVPTPGRERLIRAQEGWLRDRVELFDRYCLPAVESQNCQDFSWLVYFDPKSPPWLIDWLRRNESTRRFHTIFRTSISNSELVADLRELTGAGGDVLVTTNLDNDDGISTDFVARLQQAISGTEKKAIYLTCGIILNDSRTFLHKDRKNAFCSVVEKWDAPLTAWTDWHNRLGLVMPVTEIGGPPAWLQVVHERNVSNTVHGRVVRPSDYASSFPTVMTSLPDPGPFTILVDTMVHRPVRFLCSAGKGTLKSIMLRILGKDGFDSVKNRVAETGFFLVPPRGARRKNSPPKGTVPESGG